MPSAPAWDVEPDQLEPDTVAPEEVVEALTAVLGSDTFSTAPRCRDFLAYIVTEHLAGRADRLGEHAVARHALGRSEYDARLSSTVRVQATRLRTALQRYYEAEGRGSAIRICLPTGRYAPTITRRDPPREPSPAHDTLAVAVLRFGCTGSGAELIGTALCDAIAHRLGEFPGLTVTGPAAVAPEGAVAARLLGARFVLEGMVTTTEDTVGLEATLTEVSSGEITWRVTKRLARAALAGSRLDDRWAAAVAGQVGDATGVTFRRALACDDHDGSVVYAARLAYTDYLMKQTADSVSAAAAALDAALATGRRAELLAMRGAIHNAEVNQGATSVQRERELSSAETLAREALALDPANASAYLVLGGTAWQRREWDLAHRHAARAVELAPWSPTVLMSAGTVMAVAGDWDGGVRTLREGFRLNPLHPGSAHAVAALACLISGDDAGALAEASLVQAPGQLWGPLYRALALAALGFSDQAWTEMAQVLEIDPTFLDDPASYFTSRARFDTAELDRLLNHFEPFGAGPPL